jgi:hypothetical protein
MQDEILILKRQQEEILKVIENIFININSSETSQMTTESMLKNCGHKNVFDKHSKEVQRQKLIKRRSLRGIQAIIENSLSEIKSNFDKDEDPHKACYSRLQKIEKEFDNNHTIMQQIKQQETMIISNKATAIPMMTTDDVTTTEEEISVNPSTYGKTEFEVTNEDGKWIHLEEEIDSTPAELPRDGIT